MSYPKEIIMELRWFEYPGIKPSVNGYYLVAQGNNAFVIYWNGNEFDTEDTVINPNDTSETVYWAEVALPSYVNSIVNEADLDWHLVTSSRPRDLTPEEITQENNLYIEFCKSKGIADIPPLRLPDGKYNPDAFTIEIQGAQ